MDNQENSNPSFDKAQGETPTAEPVPSATPPTPPSAPPAAPSGGANEPTPPAAGNSAGDHKGLAIIGYIFLVLFFLPLVTEAKHDSAARFHANQQLILLIWFVIASFIGIVPPLGWIIAPLMWIFGVIVAIMGIINAVQGAQKRMPVIGKFDLIK